MNNFTTKTYKLKRKILLFSKNLSNSLSRPNQKFTSDIIYGILASRSIILSNIAYKLKERIHLSNTVERLARHLTQEIPSETKENKL